MTNDVNQKLIQAASAGDLNGVSEALQMGADVNAQDQFNDTALNQAAEYGHFEVVKHLLEAGADIHNKGGADKTPIMNSAFAGQVETVQLLLEQGARVNNDLLSSMQVKVNILKENAEAGMVSPEAVKAWESFLRFLVTARLKQDLPEIVSGLSAIEPAMRKSALERIDQAVRRGIDIAVAVDRLRELTADEDAETRTIAGSALTIHYTRARKWDRLSQLFDAGDEDVQVGGIPILVTAAQDGIDISPILPAITSLLTASSLDLRHDAAITLGYAATNGVDVSSAIPDLAQLLSDTEPEAQTMAGWALYRIAKYIGDISAAVPALQALLENENVEVREMAAEALRMAEAF
ncbi:MAG: ankyrin repeat domain-containing protein [Anaerolineae bacterium]